MGNDLIKKKFDDIDGKIDFMIELCHVLKQENEALLLKVQGFESEVEKKDTTREQFSEQEALIQTKIDGLLTKLDGFSNGAPEGESSNL